MSATLPGRAEAAPLQAAKSPLSTTDETLNSLKDITTYNNFYEFGTDKGDPAKNARTLTTAPWKVKVDGLVAQARRLSTIDDLVKPCRWRSASTACAAWKAGRW